MRTTRPAVRRASLRGVALATVIACVAWPSLQCSLVVDTNADQCSTSADCVAKGGAFVDTMCSPQHTCVVATCTTNKQCQDEHPSPGAATDPWICRHADQRCGQLLSPDCKALLADPSDIANDETVWLGTLLPIIGDYASLGLPLQNGVDLARRDFATAVNGLPPAIPGKPRRPIAFVACNDAEDPIRAATHLADDVKVPAIIGPAFSGVAIKVATEVTIPKKVLIMSASATSPFITKLADDDLVWRTAPPDTVQSQAITLLMSSKVEPDLRPPIGTVLGDKEQMRLAIVHKGDAYGTGLAEALFQSIRFNDNKNAASNGANFKSIDYGEAGKPDSDAKYKAAVDALIVYQPHVVIIIGTSEGVTKVFAPLETNWPSTVPFRPRYVLTDGAQIPELFPIVGTNADLRHRVLGTVPGTTAPGFFAFVSHYKGTITDGTSPDQYTAAAYDAAYVLSYGIVAIGQTPLSGPNLVGGLKKLVPPGNKIEVGSGAMNDAFIDLLAGKNIDFDGASGPLDFDVATGEAESDIQIWCVDVDGTGKANAFKNSGEFYNATTKKLQGTIGCP
jgi:ABC-type branched-subunit amino acid transport system substrate-binding protein